MRISWRSPPARWSGCALAGERVGAATVDYVPQPKTGEGAAGQNPPADIANDVWTRVDIRNAKIGDDGLATVTYSTSGQLARADEFEHHYDHQIVDQLITRSVVRKQRPARSGPRSTSCCSPTT